MGSSVVVVEYDPSWVLLFEQLRDFVLPVLSDLNVRIEHVGSTAVPGLAAKPIVDIDVIVSKQADVQTAILGLATLGYVHEGDLGAAGREAFIPPAGITWHHLYVCTAENDEYKRHIIFRDYLRIHPEDAKIYGNLKLELAQRFHNDRASYTNAKSEFVQEILVRAGWKCQHERGIEVRIAVATERDYDYIRDRDHHILEDLILPKIKGNEIYMLKNEEETSFGWIRYGYFWDNTPFMNMIWVDEPFRGKGVGKQAVLFWEDEMKQKGFKLVMTSTLANEEAQHFYRKLGYRDAGCLMLANEPLEIMFTKIL